MKRTKTTEIIIETDEIFVLCEAGRATNALVNCWCAACGAQAEMLSPDAAARALGANTRYVFRLVEAGVVHFAETHDGTLLVCLASLKQGAEAEGSVNTLLLNPDPRET
jgi:hypothetical protein